MACATISGYSDSLHYTVCAKWALWSNSVTYTLAEEQLSGEWLAEDITILLGHLSLKCYFTVW